MYVCLHIHAMFVLTTTGDNVLRDLKGNVKIADFGTCKHIQVRENAAIETCCYVYNTDHLHE